MSAYLEPLQEGRCTKWKLWWSTGSGSSRKKKARRFYGGKRAAQAALAEFAAECEALPIGADTLSTFIAAWSAERFAANLISDNTHAQYLWSARALEAVLPMPLKDVDKTDVHAAIAALADGNTPSGKPMAQKSLLGLCKCARTAFDEAVSRGLASTNPFRGVSVRQPKQERKALSTSGAQSLLDALSFIDPHEFAVSLILRTGMRVGECLSIAWNDLDDGRLHISREVTKTDAGVRTIPLDDDTRLFIRSRKQFVNKTLQSLGDKLYGSENLCCLNDGRPMTYNALRLWWQRHRGEYGMDGWVLHELRHTYLTNLAQAGVHPSVMQRLAGHSSMSTTMQIYTHVHDEDMQQAMDALQNARQSAPKPAPKARAKKSRSDK